MIVVLVLVAIVGLIILFVYINHHNENYYKYAVTGGEIEEKYTALGPYDVSYIDFDAGNDIYKKYEIWYPTDMMNSDQIYPLVVMANGTGVKASQYKEVFQHLSSWGFIVIGNEDENSRTGTSSAASLDFALSLNTDSSSVFYKKIDIENKQISFYKNNDDGYLYVCDFKNIEFIFVQQDIRQQLDESFTEEDVEGLIEDRDKTIKFLQKELAEKVKEIESYKNKAYIDMLYKESLELKLDTQTQLAIQELEKVKTLIQNAINFETNFVGVYDAINKQINELKGEKDVED